MFPSYNLAVEYLAAYEKQWLLDSFRTLDESFLQKQGKNVEFEFLVIHAEGEPEHADLGHKVPKTRSKILKTCMLRCFWLYLKQAVTSLVPARHQEIIARAMADHDKDFAAFYDSLTAKLA